MRTSNVPLPDRTASIEVLPDDVLLIIFCFYQVFSPLHWHRLAHVCRQWRYIVFASPRCLNLRLYCNPGTPVLKTLDCWPALPIVVQYSGCQIVDSPTSEDEDNVVAALKHSDRICSISLIVTRSLLKKLGTSVHSFPELEDLVLLCRSDPYMPFPPNFRWGTCLRSLNLTGISLSTLPQLLSASPNLVDLQLHDIISTRQRFPQNFASFLSGMTLLQSLSLHFHVLNTHLDTHPFSEERIVFPALTHIKIRGLKSDYLNSFVAQIDAPHLADIEIMLIYQHNIDVSPFMQFVDRIEKQKSHSRADILSSGCAISMTLSEPQSCSRIKMGICCRDLAEQFSSMTRICNDFSQSLLGVRDLRIETTQKPSRRYGGDGTTVENWLELIRWFGGAGRLHVAGDSELMADILRALRPLRHRFGEFTSGALPALTNIYVIGPRSMSGLLQDIVQSITALRKFSNNPIVGRVDVNSRSNKIVCLAERQDLIRHSNCCAPSQECEELCRFCHAPRLLCRSNSRERRLRRRPRLSYVHPSDLFPPHTPLTPGRRTDTPPSPLSVVPTTPLHIPDTRSNWRPVERQRDYWQFVPNLRSLGTLFNSRWRRRAGAAEPPNGQLEPLDDWSIVENALK